MRRPVKIVNSLYEELERYMVDLYAGKRRSLFCRNNHIERFIF